MKVITTSGKQFDIDFQTQEGYQQMREMQIYLKNKGFFREASDEEKLIEMIDTLKAQKPNIDINVIKMVSNHYYKVVMDRKEKGEIDDIDVPLQLAHLVVLELNDRWS
jgi:hypothetical protein